MCCAGTEEDQAEQHDQRTIDEVLEDRDMEEGGDALEEAGREADLREQMPLLGHPESEKEQIGRVERRGAMLKRMMSKVIKDTYASGRE